MMYRRRRDDDVYLLELLQSITGADSRCSLATDIVLCGIAMDPNRDKTKVRLPQDSEIGRKK